MSIIVSDKTLNAIYRSSLAAIDRMNKQLDKLNAGMQALTVEEQNYPAVLAYNTHVSLMIQSFILQATNRLTLDLTNQISTLEKQIKKIATQLFELSDNRVKRMRIIKIYKDCSKFIGKAVILVAIVKDLDETAVYQNGSTVIDLNSLSKLDNLTDLVERVEALK